MACIARPAYVWQPPATFYVSEAPFGNFRTDSHPGGDCGNPDNALTCAAPYTFTGHLYDQESGLYYFGARYYDPETGRFLSQDPVAGDALNPPSLHKYLYCYNDPMDVTDPWGERGDLEDIGASMSRNKTIVMTDVANRKTIRIPYSVAEQHKADTFYALQRVGGLNAEQAIEFIQKNELVPSQGTEDYARVVLGTAGQKADQGINALVALAATEATAVTAGLALPALGASATTTMVVESASSGAAYQLAGDAYQGRLSSPGDVAISAGGALLLGGAFYGGGRLISVGKGMLVGEAKIAPLAADTSAEIAPKTVEVRAPGPSMEGPNSPLAKAPLTDAGPSYNRGPFKVPQTSTEAPLPAGPGAARANGPEFGFAKSLPETSGVYHIEGGGFKYTGKSVNLRSRLISPKHPAHALFDMPDLKVTLYEADLPSNLTPRERARYLGVLEQRVMNEVGNVPRVGGSLNRIRALTPEKFDLYGQQFNPSFNGTRTLVSSK